MNFRRLVLVVTLGALLLGAVGVRPAHAAPPGWGTRAIVTDQTGPAAGDTFMLTVHSAYVRQAPAPDAPPLFSLFAGQTLPVLGLSLDGEWVQVVGGSQGNGWVRRSFGLVGAAGELKMPAATAVIKPVPAGVVPRATERAIEIYQLGLKLGNRPSAFAKVGDCNTENGRFLAMFEEPGAYTLGTRFNFLQSTVDNFSGSFGRTSVAAVSGFTPAAVMSAVWADPELCEPGEGPLQCEYRIMRPSFALIALGTHYGPNIREFEDGYRLVIEESIKLGVVPILTTKADDLEGQGRVNAIIRKLAAEYDLPLWDFWAAAQPLPGDGLSSDGIHLSYGRSIFDDPWAMSRGWTWRNLTALLALEAVWHGVAGASAAERTLPRR